jgi:hypothetical protein
MRRIEVLEICFGYVDGFCMSIRVGYYCILLLYLKVCLDEGFWMGGLIFLWLSNIFQNMDFAVQSPPLQTLQNPIPKHTLYSVVKSQPRRISVAGFWLSAMWPILWRMVMPRRHTSDMVVLYVSRYGGFLTLCHGQPSTTLTLWFACKKTHVYFLLFKSVLDYLIRRCNYICQCYISSMHW